MTPRSDMQPDATRRAFIVRAAYAAPAILTLAAAPAYAKAGSEKPRESTGSRDDDRRERRSDRDDRPRRPRRSRGDRSTLTSGSRPQL
jgi:hypothetical protein